MICCRGEGEVNSHQPTPVLFFGFSRRVFWEREQGSGGLFPVRCAHPGVQHGRVVQHGADGDPHGGVNPGHAAPEILDLAFLVTKGAANLLIGQIETFLEGCNQFRACFFGLLVGDAGQVFGAVVKAIFPFDAVPPVDDGDFGEGVGGFGENLEVTGKGDQAGKINGLCAPVGPGQGQPERRVGFAQRRNFIQAGHCRAPTLLTVFGPPGHQFDNVTL